MIQPVGTYTGSGGFSLPAFFVETYGNLLWDKI